MEQADQGFARDDAERSHGQASPDRVPGRRSGRKIAALLRKRARNLPLSSVPGGKHPLRPAAHP